MRRSFRRILLAQAARYPRLRIKDLYKLAHQAAMGSEHAIRNEAAAREWLEREWRALGPGPEEPVSDPISPDGDIARVNLRPYKACGGSRAALLSAFLRTAARCQGAAGDLERYWSYAERAAAQGRLPFSVKGMRRFFNVQKARGFPAAHHSRTYASAYRPAYRVVLFDMMAKSGRDRTGWLAKRGRPCTI